MFFVLGVDKVIQVFSSAEYVVGIVDLYKFVVSGIC